MNKKKDRFDLEQEIMKCWHITDDIDMLYENVCDNHTGKFDMKPEVNDRLANVLLGMKELYEIRFERLWSTFEEVVQSGDL